MSDLELKDALQGLKLMEISDLGRYKSALSSGVQMGFAYYFPNIMSHNRPGRTAILFEEIHGSICLYRWKRVDNKTKLDIFAAPAPMNEIALRACIERANDYNHSYSARILKVDEKDVKAVVAHSPVKIKKWKTQYLYAPNSFVDLSGGRFRTLRRNVAKIRARDDVEVIPYSPHYRTACSSLLQTWRIRHQKTYKTSGSTGNTRILLELTQFLDSPDLLGELIFIDSKLAAFSLGGEIRPGYGAFLEAKCDRNIPGLSYFQRYSFLSKLSNFDLVNDGSDLRRTGLAQLKNSLRPTEMHIEYRGMQTNGRKAAITSIGTLPPGPEPANEAKSDLLSGALAGLRTLQISDLFRYQAALEESDQMGWGYYFPFLMTRNRPGVTATLSVEDEGSICLYLLRHAEGKPRIDLLVAPIPMSPAVLLRSIERANEFNHDYSARILRIDAKDSSTLKDIGFRVRERKKQYIFSPGNYDDLGGKKYYTLRRNVSLIERRSDVAVETYTSQHFEDCRILLDRWAKAHRAKHGTAGGAGTSRRILELAGLLPASILRGQVIFVEGRLVAFAFGGQIRPGLGCSFERKCDIGLRGMSHFQLRSFLRSFDDGDLINDGSDAGSPGLRQMKDGFRPILMHSEYRGSQRLSER